MSRSALLLKTIKIAVSTALFAAIISGCSDQNNKNYAGVSPSPSAQSSAPAVHGPAHGGTLTYGLASSPSGLDPNLVPGAVDYRVMRNIYDSLVVQMPDNSFKPWLATEYSVSDDGRVYTFKLRKDVTFHDGTPFNAQAVKYNFDRIVNPATKSKFAVTLLGPYESSQVIDDYTVQVNLKSPYSAFLSSLSQAFLGIVSPAAAEKYGDQLQKNPVGTGPFKFVSWVEKVEVVLERNPDYNWGPAIADNKGQNHLDKLVFKIITEEATRVGGLQSGQVLAVDSVPPQNVAALKADSKFKVLQADSAGVPYTLMLNQEHAPWNELNARKAVQLGIDVDAIVNTLYLGVYKRAWSTLVPSALGYEAGLENKVKPDSAKAGQLLDELGWKPGPDGIRVKDGKRLTIYYVLDAVNREKRHDIATIIQQQLKKLGIEVNIELSTTVSTLTGQGVNDLAGVSNVSGDPDVLRSVFHSNVIPTPEKFGHNHAHVKDPQLNQWLEDGLKENDPGKRAEIYKKVQNYLIDNAVGFPIYIFPYVVGTSKSVEGLKFDPLGYPLFYDVSIAK
ncbi:MAG: transporter substrate-binding protein [Paenibacillaceae bacterium]|jgi:peptide/nickel transport system substrate-binding protein|nr:transporter substrate-binding protein [Paenibacillaceae bacterium]